MNEKIRHNKSSVQTAMLLQVQPDTISRNAQAKAVIVTFSVSGGTIF